MHEARGPIPSSKFQVLLPSLLEIALPTAGYFLLHAAGVGDFWALTTVGVSTRGVAVANTVRRRRLDNLGLLVVLEVAFSIFLLFLARDPEILLLRPSSTYWPRLSLESLWSSKLPNRWRRDAIPCARLPTNEHANIPRNSVDSGEN